MKDRPDMEGLWKSSRRYILIVTVGILAYELLENLARVRSSISAFLSVISPVFIGIAIGFIVNMPMSFLERRVFARWRSAGARRAVCLLLAVAFVLAIIAALLVFILPSLGESVVTLAEDFDKYAYSLMEWGNDMWGRLNLNPEVVAKMEGYAGELLEQVDDIISGAVSWLLKFTMNAAGTVVDFFFAAIISIYALFNKETLLRQARKLTKALFSRRAAEGIIDVAGRTNESLRNYAFGMIIECSILGGLCFIGMSLLNFPFALLISVLVGVSQLIPIVGPWISAAVGVFIIFVVDPPRALWFLIFILAVQQVEGNLIYPRVVGNAVGISGMWVLIAVMLGGRLFGLTGAILCVPVMAVLYTLTREWVNKRLEEKRIAEED